jgi:hypothetical protein
MQMTVWFIVRPGICDCCRVQARAAYSEPDPRCHAAGRRNKGDPNRFPWIDHRVRGLQQDSRQVVLTYGPDLARFKRVFVICLAARIAAQLLTRKLMEPLDDATMQIL